MEKKFIRQLFCISIFLPILIGCGYTEPVRKSTQVLHGDIIDVFPATYFVNTIESTQVEGAYIVLDRYSGHQEDAMKIAWSRDADAYINVSYKTWREYQQWYDGPGYYVDKDSFSGTLIKYIKYIYPTDNAIVTFNFPASLWISATVNRFNGPMVFQFEDEKKDYFELDTKDLDPGIYEIHVRAGDYPLWTHRGTRWDTSRWIEIVK
jgi:hypothetical protein